MAELKGADLERLTQTAETVADGASVIRGVAGALNRIVAESNAVWHGNDAEEFRTAWKNSHDRLLVAAAESLSAAAVVIERNVEAQRLTSAVDGIAGSIGSGVPIAPTRGGSPPSGFFELVDAAGAAWEEGRHRFSEFGEYWDAWSDRRDGSAGDLWDDLTLTTDSELAAAAISILGFGGEFEQGAGGGEAEFITGVSTPLGGALTVGHTVIFDDISQMDRLADHEMQHVRDIEMVGAVPFYTSYALDWIGNVISGDDPSPGGEAYENIIWEKRAEAAEHGGTRIVGDIPVAGSDVDGNKSPFTFKEDPSD